MPKTTRHPDMSSEFNLISCATAAGGKHGKNSPNVTVVRDRSNFRNMTSARPETNFAAKYASGYRNIGHLSDARLTRRMINLIAITTNNSLAKWVRRAGLV